MKILALVSWLVALLCSLEGLGERTACSPTGTIDGVVLVAARGEQLPLVAHPVRLEIVGRRSVEVLTDERGRFSLPRVENARSEVVVSHASGLRVTSNRRDVGAAGEELRFIARRVPTRPFQGLALRRGTREPLRFSRIRIVERNGPSEVCTTDGQGRFRTRQEFAAVRLQLRCQDNHEYLSGLVGEQAQVSWSHERSPATVPVELPVGPRLELDVRLPAGSEAREYRVEVVAAGALPGQPGSRARRATLHAGQPPWVRLRAGSELLAGGSVYLLAQHGSRAWRAPLPADGEQADRAGAAPRAPLALGPLECGRLVGRISESIASEGRWVGTGSRAHLAPSAHVRAGARLVFERLESAGGEPCSFRYHAPIGREFQLSWVPAGTWRVRLESAYYPGLESELLVPADGEGSLQLTLGRPRATGTIHVRVLDAAGDYPDPRDDPLARYLSVLVLGPEGRGLHTIDYYTACGVGADASFRRVEREGRWILEAELEDMPPGEYSLRGMSWTRLFAPAEDLVHPGESATLHLQRADPRRAFGFRSDLTPPEPAYSHRVVSLARDPDFPLAEFPDLHGVHSYEVPADAELAWCLIVRGYRRVYGDRSDFVRQAAGHWARVHLEAGYSLRLRASLEDGSPAGGVDLRFAGRSLRTDDEGRALLESEDPRPERRVELRGWRIVAGDAGAGGEFDGGLAELRLVVRRAP